MIGKAINYFKGVVAEFKKVSFPSKEKLVQDTLVVLAVAVIGVIVIGAIDGGIAFIIEKTILK